MGKELNELDELLPRSRDEANGFSWPDTLDQEVADLKPFVDQAMEYLDKLQDEDRRQIESDFDRLESVRTRRVAYLEKLRKSVEEGEIGVRIEPAILKPESI